VWADELACKPDHGSILGLGRSIALASRYTFQCFAAFIRLLRAPVPQACPTMVYPGAAPLDCQARPERVTPSPTVRDQRGVLRRRALQGRVGPAALLSAPAVRLYSDATRGPTLALPARERSTR
jgi:hypothetical protein